jgi:hypothetical protein
MKFYLALASTLCLGLVGISQAANCGATTSYSGYSGRAFNARAHSRQRTVTYQYHKPAAAVYAPAQAQAYTYTQATAHAQYYPIQVKKAAPYFYTVGDSYDKALLADAVAYRVLQQLGRQQAAPAPTYQPQYQPQPQYQHPQALPQAAPQYEAPQAQKPELAPPPQPCPNGDCNQAYSPNLFPPQKGQVSTQSVNIGQAVQEVCNNSCVSCHSKPGHNKIDLTDVSKLTKVQRGKCAALVTAKVMPKGASASDQIRQLFEIWADEK